MSERVRGIGPRGATILLVGEAPGADEVRFGAPFVGKAGQLLDELLDHAGLRRADIRIENVIEERPPSNKLDALTPERMQFWFDDFAARFAELRPRVVVPLGNVALNAVLGGTFKKGKQGYAWQHKITKLRGYPQTMLRTELAIVLPTIHPAAILRMGSWRYRAERDFGRIAEIACSPSAGMVTPRAVEIIRDEDTLVEKREWLHRTEYNTLGIDIETAGSQILCVGFGVPGVGGIVIPTTMSAWGNRKKPLYYAWQTIAAICRTHVPKALHNGLFDTFMLRMERSIEITNFAYDTMYMHQCLAPQDEHSLEHCASMDVWTPPFKQTDWNDIESIMRRCGQDACLTAELAETYIQELTTHGRIEFYLEAYKQFLPMLLDLMTHGIAVDVETRTRLAAIAQQEMELLRNAIRETAGTALHAKTGLSNKKIQSYFYDTLGCKEQRHVRTKRRTVDEVAIRRLMRRYPRAKPVGELVLRYRRAQKLGEFVAEARVDDDGRMRSSYGIDTDTGRLSSKTNPRGTGSNAQNQDRSIRGMFVPDMDCVFVEVDASQGESRIVGMLSEDKKLVDMARTPPDEFDIHRYNAAIVFGVRESDVTKEQRYLGKRAVHASNYGMEGGMLSAVLAKDGIFLDDKECQALIDRYLDAFPAIVRWQQRVRIEILRHRMLANRWGRFLDLRHEVLNKHTYKRGYAFGPQSNLVGLVNLWGWLPFVQWIRDTKRAVRINAHMHDALLFSARPDDVAACVTQLVSTLSRPCTYSPAGALVMPLTVKVGHSWASEDMTEWKAIPTAREIRDASHLHFARVQDQLTGDRGSQHIST